MNARIRELRPDDIAACDAILSGLPEWFGLPESNRSYIEGLSHLPAAVAEHEDHIIGFVSLRVHNARSAEIEAMAIGMLIEELVETLVAVRFFIRAVTNGSP